MNITAATRRHRPPLVATLGNRMVFYPDAEVAQRSSQLYSSSPTSQTSLGGLHSLNNGAGTPLQDGQETDVVCAKKTKAAKLKIRTTCLCSTSCSSPAFYKLQLYPTICVTLFLFVSETKGQTECLHHSTFIRQSLCTFIILIT